MVRGIHIVLRFLVGIIAMTLMLHFFDLSWAELGKMAADGIKGILEVFNAIKRIQI